VRWLFTARVERSYRYSFQACLFSLQGWGLIDLLLRAFNEGLLRPRVARAQKIIRLHPIPPRRSLFLYFLLLFPYFTLRPLPQPDDIILVLEPDQRADEERKD
jgi:hypothetical protein